MKKKLLTFILGIALIGCEKSINITTPTILIEKETMTVSEPVKIRVEEYADIDGVQVFADYYEWRIEDTDGIVIEDDFNDSSAVFWSPEMAGYFVIKVKIGYDNNKSITALKEVHVFENENSLREKMAGHWQGTGTKRWKGDWGIDLYIDSTGHYYGTADYYSFDPYCEKGVFHTERLDYHINWVHDSCGVPGEVPCQRLELTQAIDNKGYGYAWTGDITYNNGVFVSQDCYDTWKIEDLQFSEDGNELYFEFNERWEQYYDWIMKFTLIRQ